MIKTLLVAFAVLVFLAFLLIALMFKSVLDLVSDPDYNESTKGDIYDRDYPVSTG